MMDPSFLDNPSGPSDPYEEEEKGRHSAELVEQSWTRGKRGGGKEEVVGLCAQPRKIHTGERRELESGEGWMEEGPPRGSPEYRLGGGADEEETQSLYPDQREGRLNVTFKSSRRIDSGPSGSSGKYRGLTGDTKLNNQRSPGREFHCSTPLRSGSTSWAEEDIWIQQQRGEPAKRGEERVIQQTQKWQELD
ncbi:hypothetical protein INR49_023695 [Caranx melampygus]|nr:hypothetical protein INR49_023695 [Caranx melampygus]